MRPDDREVQDFIADSMVAEVATLSRKGTPSLTPLWFVCDRGRIYMGTGQATLTVRNVAAHPNVDLLFDGERRGGSERVLRISGAAVCHKEYPNLRLVLRFAMKHYLTPGGLRSELAHWRKWRLRQRYYGQGKPAVIEVMPETAEFLPRITS
jgi:hypothetical protein